MKVRGCAFACLSVFLTDIHSFIPAAKGTLGGAFPRPRTRALRLRENCLGNVASRLYV